MRTTAVLDGDEYIVNGSKTWISNAQIADVCLLVAKDENGEQNFFLLDKERSPFETSELHKIGLRASPTGEIFFDNCRVPKENNLTNMIMDALQDPGKLMKRLELPEEYMDLLGKMGFIDLFGVMSPISAIFIPMRAGMSLWATGISQASLDASIKYAKERVQFGKPIGKFQMIQEMLYEIDSLTEASRLLGYRALDLFSRGNPEACKASSLAKAYSCEVSVKATYYATQIHGGMGLSDELPIERYYRDARMMTIPDGTSEIQKLVVGRELLGKGFSAYV